MKLKLTEDERYPYVFVDTVEGLTESHEKWRAHIKRTQNGRDLGEVDLRGFRDVPDDLGAELVALRKREAELLDLIHEHLVATGQPTFRED